MNNEIKSRDNVFKLIDIIRDYDLYIRKYLLNSIPKIHNDLRIHMSDELYDLIKNIKLSTLTKGNIQLKHLTDSLLNISMLDYINNNLIELKICELNKIEKSISKLTSIKNITYSWFNKLNEKN